MIDRLAINAKLSSSGSGNSGGDKMVAIAAKSEVIMWGVSDEGQDNFYN